MKNLELSLIRARKNKDSKHQVRIGMSVEFDDQNEALKFNSELIKLITNYKLK